jgi:uncharacterized protein YacL
MTIAQELVTTYPRLSTQDVLAFLLAERTDSTLVTGDRNLRKLASSRNVDCHGTLWVLDLLLDCKKITAEVACIALQTMVAENAFLPQVEVQKRLQMWCPAD